MYKLYKLLVKRLIFITIVRLKVNELNKIRFAYFSVNNMVIMVVYIIIKGKNGT